MNGQVRMKSALIARTEISGVMVTTSSCMHPRLIHHHDHSTGLTFDNSYFTYFDDPNEPAACGYTVPPPNTGILNAFGNAMAIMGQQRRCLWQPRSVTVNAA
jgi:hypothetical protein